MSASASWDKVPDDELVARARAGDLAAFDSIVKRYSPVMLGFFLKELGGDQFQQAEDLASETMAAAWTTLKNGQSTLPENLKAWFFGTARHILSRYFREKYARGEVLVFEPEIYDAADTRAPDDFREVEYEQGLPRFLRLVDDAVESMAAKYRDVIRINMRDGSTGKALAAQLGVTPAEASRRLNEARPRLTKAVGTLLVARTCREACPKLDSYLQRAGWTGGAFGEELRQRLMQHLSSCSICEAARSREMNWMAILPVVVPTLVAPEVYQRFLHLPFATHHVNPPSASHDPNQGFDGGTAAAKGSSTPSRSTNGSTGATDPSANKSTDFSDTTDTPTNVAFVTGAPMTVASVDDSPTHTLSDNEGNHDLKHRGRLVLLLLVLLLSIVFPGLLSDGASTYPPISMKPATQEIANQVDPAQPQPNVPSVASSGTHLPGTDPQRTGPIGPTGSAGGNLLGWTSQGCGALPRSKRHW